MPFHSIVSARLPCVQDACENSTLPGHVRPCLQLSNSFGGAEVEHWQVQGGGGPWPLNGSDPNHCNQTDYPIVCLTDPATVAAALAVLPAGQRSIAPIALYAPRVEGRKDPTLDKTAAWDLDSTGSFRRNSSSLSVPVRIPSTNQMNKTEKLPCFPLSPWIRENQTIVVCGRCFSSVHSHSV